MKTVVAFLGLALAFAPAQTLRSAAGRHRVLIGAAVDTRSLSDAAYAAVVAQQFNMIEAENEMKWTATEPQQGSFRFEAGDKLADFAQAHGMQLRGHNLCWHSYNPAWLAKGKFTPAELSAMLEKHIATVVSHFAGKVFAWDVVNEALDPDGKMRDSIWSAPGYIDRTFRWAHAADPRALLFYNDYSVEDAHHNAKSDAMYELLKGMLARGVPVHGAGLQLHVSIDPKDVTMDGLDANIARLTALGLQVHLTELDVRIPVDAQGNAAESDLAAQARRYREIVAVCLKHAGCTAIQTWGVTDRRSWIPRQYPGQGAALLFDRDLQPKPAFRAMLEAFGANGATGN